jgi:hypothetical protein
MSAITPTRSQSIIVETPESAAAEAAKTGRYFGDASQELVGWIVSKVNIWEDVRNRGYQRLWGEYWRMWRGKWNEVDMNRLSERSRLVAPALSQAIEMTVSEIEEAIFSKQEWFDVADDIVDKIANKLRDQLIEDLDKVNARDQIIEAIMNGAIFGTIIAKVNVFVGEDKKPKRDPATFELKAKGNQRVFVTIESIRPDQFIPDPVGQTVQDMLGCAQRIQRTMHYVLERIEQGIYRKDSITQLSAVRRIKNSDVDSEDPQSVNTAYESSQVDLIEYHGKVPLRLLEMVTRSESELKDILDAEGNPKQVTEFTGAGDGPMVEAIVTIANTSVLLRCMANPFVMQDRSIVAAQFEKVPGRFWGRGIAEKGYNPQKALDSELRARIDALGFINAPMLAIDAGRMPKGFRFEVKPGKVWTTQGPPADVLVPVKIGDYSTLTFEQTQEMERMVQMGTGAFDTASALKSQSQSGSNSSSANSMLMGAFVKRAKRSINNIDRNFLTPLLNKVKWRYMQFDPIRYPADYELKIKTTMGIVAREVEASQMTQLIGMMPEEFHSVQLALIEGIVDSTSLQNKQEIMDMIQAVTHPSPQAQQQQQQQQAQAQHMQEQMQQALLQKTMLENQKLVAEVKKLLAGASEIEHEAATKVAQLHQGWEQLQLKKQEQAQFAEQNQIAAAGLPIKAMLAHAALIAAKKKPAGAAK